MMKILELLSGKKKLIVMTFEAFWIIVFLLNSLGNQAGNQIPQFVYVNF